MEFWSICTRQVLCFARHSQIPHHSWMSSNTVWSVISVTYTQCLTVTLFLFSQIYLLLLLGSMHSNLTPSSHYAPGSLQNLRSHVRSYLIFCATTACHYLPVSISHICNYLVFLSRTVSYATIKNHLSSLHLFYQLHNIPTDFPKDVWISLTLRGIKHIIGNTQSSKLPITPSILNRIYTTVDFSSSLDCVFWTACLLAFFTFFRKSNLFPSSAIHFDPQRNSTRSDIQLFPSFGFGLCHLD